MNKETVTIKKSIKRKLVSESSSNESDEDIILNDESDHKGNYDMECFFCTNLYSFNSNEFNAQNVTDGLRD